MPISYTNRKGKVYYLHQSATKTSKARYYFTPQAGENVLEQIPEGYEIVESLNGIVSLRRAQPELITAAEVRVVEDELAKHSHLAGYKVAVKKNTIVVNQPLNVVDDEMARTIFGVGIMPEFLRKRFRQINEEHVRYEPMMRFILRDDSTRKFEVQRMCYHPANEGWLSLYDSGKLNKMVKRYVHHLGKESFFELM